MEHAARVVVSHPDELSEWGRRQLYGDRFRAYLRRTLADLTPGREWEEFLDVGCCGNTLDVPLRIETVRGPPRMGPDTEIEFVEREASMAGGWLVQSAAGPGGRTAPDG
ncbi:MAG: hypothetical protein ABEH40_08925 [Haloferacaceae archaeon]